MSDRYSASDIEMMRNAIRFKLKAWQTLQLVPFSEQVVEDQLRTHLQNGTPCADLVKECGGIAYPDTNIGIRIT